jgi:hypothetical protein
VHPEVLGEYCARCSFNPTYRDPPEGPTGWHSPYFFGLNLGPVVLMVENSRTGLLWRLMRGCAPLVTGLRRAGFANGWLA